MRVSGDTNWPGIAPAQTREGTGEAAAGGFDLAVLLASLGAAATPAVPTPPRTLDLSAPPQIADAPAADRPTLGTPVEERWDDLPWQAADRARLDRALQAAWSTAVSAPHAAPEQGHAQLPDAAEEPATPEPTEAPSAHLAPSTPVDIAIVPVPAVMNTAPEALVQPATAPAAGFAEPTAPVHFDDRAPLAPSRSPVPTPTPEPAPAPLSEQPVPPARQSETSAQVSAAIPATASPAPALPVTTPAPTGPSTPQGVVPAPAADAPQPMAPDTRQVAATSPAPVVRTETQNAAPATRRRETPGDARTAAVATSPLNSPQTPAPQPPVAVAPVTAPSPHLQRDDERPVVAPTAHAPAWSGGVSGASGQTPTTSTVHAEPLPPAAPSAGWTDVPTTDSGEAAHTALVDTMRWQRAAGGGTMQIRLRPEHFGEVTVTVQVQQGHVSATLSTSTSAAAEYFQSEAATLRDMLHERGLVLDRFDIREREDAPRRDNDQPPPRDTPRRRTGDRQPQDIFEVVV